MTDRPRSFAILAVLALAGCAAWQPAREEPPPPPAAAASNGCTEYDAYLGVLSDLAKGDAARQQEILREMAQAEAASPTPANRLRHALALGTAGVTASNPVEARRLLADLLAVPNQLEPGERALAEAFLREFDARVALTAELSRQSERTEAQLASQAVADRQRVEALGAENARLRRSLAEADRKLKAVAEMERQSLEQAGQAETPPER